MRKETCKSVGKKVLASALSAAMVVAFAPAASVAVVGAAASDAVAFADEGASDSTVEVKDGAELKNAVSDTNGAQEIRLAEDITLDDTLSIDRSVVIDLNGKCLNGSGKSGSPVAKCIIAGVKVEIKNGVVKNGNAGFDWSAGELVLTGVNLETSQDAIRCCNSATVTVGKGSVVKSKNANAAYIEGSLTDVEANSPVLNVYGEMLAEGDYAAIQGNGSDRVGTKVNIYDGAKVNATKLAIYYPQRGELNVYGGIIEGYAGIGMKSGSLNISGGTVKGVHNDTALGDEHSTTNGINYDGSAIVIDSYVGYAGQMNVNISGDAIVESRYSTAIREIGNASGQTNVVSINVEGGTLKAGSDKEGIKVRDVTKGTVSVSGGTFSNIENALQYASDGATLKLGASNTVSSPLSIDKKITLDLNDESITGNATRVFHVKSGGDLTLSGKGLVTTSGNLAVNSSVIRIGDDAVGNATLTVDDGVAIEAPSSYGVGAFGTTAEKVIINGTVKSTAPENGDYDGCAVTTLGTDNTPATISLGKTAIISAANSNAVYMPSGNLTVDGASVEGLTGVYVKSGKTIVNGGFIKGTGAKKDYNYYGNGGVSTGDAFVVDSCGYPSGTPEVEIKGGTFKSANALAVGGYKTDGNSEGIIKISAGAFSSDPDSSYKAAGTETHLSTTDKMYYVHAQNADVRSDSAKAPTCTEPGYTADSYCGIDGYVYSSGSTIPALGHEAGEYVVTAPATETSEGVATSTCTRCGEVLGTKTIEKLKPAGTEESGMSDTGEKVDVTVSDNTPGKTESGTEYVGSVEFNGTDSGSTGQPSSEASIPETVEVNGSTYVVTKIADEAFKDQEQLKSISIPATVVEVGKSAFEGTGIKSINIPAATSSIGVSAFKGCADLKTINIQSAALKEIPASAFEGCASLQTANVPATVEKVGAKAFAGTAISDVVLPEATTEVGASAFKNCESLKTVEFKGGVTVISDSLFQGAKALEAIELPTSVTTVGKSAFEGTALKSLALPAAVKSVGSKAFASTPITSIVPAAKTTMAVAASGDGTLVLPAGLTTLGTSAFAGCASLKTATLPTKVKALAASTFSGCTALKSVDISGATTIGKSAFAGDKALKSLKTGTKLTAIGSSALSGAKALKTLNVSTKKLTKKGVKSSLKGSSVKAVKVKASKSKKTNKKYIAKYKKYFAKKNSGKKVTVK